MVQSRSDQTKVRKKPQQRYFNTDQIFAIGRSRDTVINSYQLDLSTCPSWAQVPYGPYPSYVRLTILIRLVDNTLMVEPATSGTGQTLTDNGCYNEHAPLTVIIWKVVFPNLQKIRKRHG